MALIGRGSVFVFAAAALAAGCGPFGDYDEARMRKCIEKQGGQMRPATPIELPSAKTQQTLLTKNGAQPFTVLTGGINPKELRIVLYPNENAARKAAGNPVFSKDAYPLKRRGKNAVALATTYDEPDPRSRTLAEMCVK